MNQFDAEGAVVGACLIAPDAYWRVADLLGPDDFASSQLGEMWIALGEILRTGAQVDAITFGERCPKHAVSAVQLADATPGATNVRAYAEIVQRNAITRRVRAAGQRMAKLGGDDVLGEAQRILASCAPRVASSVHHVKHYLQQSVAAMAERCEQTEVLTGVPTSLDWLDMQTAGLQRGDLIILAARPSVGKTAMAVQVATHAALSGLPVLFLSLEMTGAQLTDRMLAHVAGVDMQAIRQPKRMDEADWTRVGAAGEKIAGAKLRIDDTSALRVEELGARIRQADATERLTLVVIDYLTQIVPPKAQSVVEGVQAITRYLKALAKNLGVPIVLLSQLNRGEGTNPRPTLKSLRDSGAIEQDADVVLFLHRPDDDNRALIEFSIAKQRNGPIGETFLHFDGATQTFTPTMERARPKRSNVIALAPEVA